MADTVPRRTLAEDCQRLHDTASDLFWAAAYGLRLPGFIAWLSDRLERRQR